MFLVAQSSRKFIRVSSVLAPVYPDKYEFGKVFIEENLTCQLNDLTTTFCKYGHVAEKEPNL